MFHRHAGAYPATRGQLLPLPVLAVMLGVHVRTLHLAARLGRLTVVYDTRTTFRRLRPRATRAAALAFRHLHYRKHGRRGSPAHLGNRSGGLRSEEHTSEL